MSDAGHLVVTATGEMSDLESKLKKSGIAVKDFASKAEQAMGRAGRGTKIGADQATNALTNLSRVAQDAPFGFMGIANNLNPLLESFQRLRAETGSVKGALSALASSLIGAGGIGLALSAFQFFALGGVDAIKKMFGATGKLKEEIDAAKKATEAYNNAVRDNAVQYQKQVESINALVSVAKSDTSTKKQQHDALVALNKIIPDNVGVLTKQNLVTAEGTRIIKEYTTAIEAKALAELLSGRIAELQVQKIDRGNQFLKEYVGNLKEQAAAQQRVARFENASAAERSKEGFAFQQQEAYNKLNETQQRGIKITEQYKGSYKDLNGTIQGYRKEVEKATAISAVLEVPDVKVNIKNPKKVKEEFEKKIRDSLIDSSSSKEPVIPVDIKPMSNLSEPLQASGADTARTARILLLKIQTEELATIVENTLSPAFESFFETLTTGSGNAFESFAQALGKTIQKLSVTLLKAVALGAVIAAITGKPFNIQAILGKSLGVKGFATGGDNIRGGTYLVGERGPELMRVPGGSDIVPNRALNMQSLGGGGGSMQVSGEFKLRDRELVAVIDRYEARRGRNG